MADVPLVELRALLRELHSGPAQEAAAAREVEARIEALFDALAALEARGKELLRRAESGVSTDPAG